MIGSELGRREAEVRWRVAGRILLTWVLAPPAAALVSGVAVTIAAEGGTAGTLGVALVGVVVGAVLYLLSRRNPVHARNVNEVPPVAAAAAPETASV